VASYTTRYIPGFLISSLLLSYICRYEEPAHFSRIMVQLGGWTPMTVLDWQVSGIQCMLSPSNSPLSLVVLALTSYKPITLISTASNPSQVCKLRSPLHPIHGWSFFFGHYGVPPIGSIQVLLLINVHRFTFSCSACQEISLCCILYPQSIWLCARPSAL